MANYIVGGIVLALVLCAIRAIWKQHKAGRCTGDCAGCGGCCRRQEEQGGTKR